MSLRVFICLLLAALSASAGEAHWAYRPIENPPVPPGDSRNAIDRFVRTRLAKEQIQPSPRADAGTLLRRVSLDLTGLPPSREEADAFVREPSPVQYAQAVERLLASPRFGERWAAWWLDSARYADSQGYEKDNFRAVWAYRDWVIQAFNSDMPFDRFTIEQLAGDLLPNPTPHQLVATAFHRMTMTNTEGGTDTEEFRIKAVMDRTSTTGQVWLGVPFGCAQCHDHPHAPFTQRDFYGLMAFFNNTEDANRADEKPLLTLRPLASEPRVRELEEERNRLQKSASGENAAARIAEIDRQIGEIPETTVPIMRELAADQRRETHLFRRGAWLDPADLITPSTPAALPPMHGDLSHDRLGLAKWIVSDENPLAARALVNRIWAQLFGKGLLAGDDFTAPNDAPSHPELLDQLAYRLVHEWHWSVKSLLREIVLSETYQQSSRVTPELLQRDPENRLLSRGARFRLPAEMLRDQALAVSGLLSKKMYGRSVMPPQPDGTWQVVYSVQRWRAERGEEKYRRALYTFWRRTSPFPALALLDAPSREACVTARSTATASPHAALAMLNDEVIADASQALGNQMRASAMDDDAQIAFGYKRILFRAPSADEMTALRELLHAAQQADPQHEGEPLTSVARVLFNMDSAWMHE